MPGNIRLIIGPMFSQKTTCLTGYIHRYRSIGRTVLVVNHASDVRYGRNSLCTHDGTSVPCRMRHDLQGLRNEPDYADASSIFIEEGQFFDDLAPFCKDAAGLDGKEVIVAALVATFDRKMFPSVAELIPYADHIEHRTALCCVCRDGTPAPFTKRTTAIEGCLVGGSESYAAVCGLHHGSPHRD